MVDGKYFEPYEFPYIYGISEIQDRYLSIYIEVGNLCLFMAFIEATDACFRVTTVVNHQKYLRFPWKDKYFHIIAFLIGCHQQQDVEPDIEACLFHTIVL